MWGGKFSGAPVLKLPGVCCFPCWDASNITVMKKSQYGSPKQNPQDSTGNTSNQTIDETWGRKLQIIAVWCLIGGISNICH